MSKEMEFTIFCVENYKHYKNLTGKQTVELFNRYGVFDYLREFYRCSSHHRASIYQSRYRHIPQRKKCNNNRIIFFTDRQDFSLPVGSYIFCSEAFAFESILSIDSNKTWPLPQYSKGRCNA